MDSRQNERVDSHVEDGPPKRGQLGTVVEAVTGLCYLFGILVLLVAQIEGKAVSARLSNVVPLLFIGGTSWLTLVGGLLTTFWPRAMAGTLFEEHVLRWHAPRRRAGVILAAGGAFWAVVTVLLWATIYRGLLWQQGLDFLLAGTVLTGVPFLMLVLGIPPVGRQRHREVMRRRQRN